MVRTKDLRRIIQTTEEIIVEENIQGILGPGKAQLKLFQL